MMMMMMITSMVSGRGVLEVSGRKVTRMAATRATTPKKVVGIRLSYSANIAT